MVKVHTGRQLVDHLKRRNQLKGLRRNEERLLRRYMYKHSSEYNQKMIAALKESLRRKTPVDKILDQMINENIGFSKYSEGNEYERAITTEPVYKMFKDLYEDRDMKNYSRLSFEDYVAGLRPEEAFITSLQSKQPTPESIVWSEQFGEDTELMKQAVFDFGKGYDTHNYPTVNNTYKQGE